MREQLASIWKNLEEYICCALLGVIMTLLMMQVCYRLLRRQVHRMV